MAAAAAVMRQVDLTLERALQQRPGLRGLDAAVVDAVGKHDEVAGEPVTADVGRLPDPLLVDLLAHGVVERPAELRATAIVLAVGADEEERVLDLIAGARKIELEQVVVALELDAAHSAPVSVVRATNATSPSRLRRSWRRTKRIRLCGREALCRPRCAFNSGESVEPSMAS